MTEKLRKIFESFVDANELEFRADFAGGGVVYTGMGFIDLTEERLRQTVDFAGFLDGWSGNPNKYAPSGKGSLDPKRSDNSAAGAIRQDIERVFTSSGDPLLISGVHRGQEFLDRLDEALSDTPQGRYERQYSLGQSANTLND